MENTKTAFAIMLLLMAMFSLKAQTENEIAKRFENIACKQSAAKCITVKIKTDTDGRKFLYEWNMGDGTTHQGISVEHCYAEYGVYNVRLRLIDVKNGNSIEDEITKNLIVNQLPTIEIPEKIVAGRKMEYNYTYAKPQGFTVENIFWNFGDLAFLHGATVSYAHLLPGSSTVSILVTGYFQGRYAEVCSSRAVIIERFNTEAQPIKEFFDAKEKRLPTCALFLKDIVHVALVEENSSSSPIVFTLDTLGYYADVKPNKDYRVYAWRGNLFVKFNSGQEAEVNDRWKAALKSMLEHEPNYLGHVYFDLDAPTISDKELNRNIALLKQYNLSSAIGIYTHAGGRPGRNVNLSRQRASWLLDYMTQQGLDPKRISLYTANEDHRLLNSCAGMGDCEVENVALNRRAEFKIVFNTGGNTVSSN
jgi:outer membrane protein OmpA-like peptidoglycan-associated protein